MKNSVLVSLGLGIAAALAGCAGGGGGHHGGGGGGGGGDGGGGVGAGVGGTVTIVEPGAGIYPQAVEGAQLTFEAKVSSSNGSPISWGVQPGDTCSATGASSLGTLGGTMTVGTLPSSSADKAVISYTAPATPPAGSAVTVTALQAPSTTGPCVVVFIVPTQSSLLNFTFAFSFNGFSGASGLPFATIGRFLADGNGHITSGLEDVNIAQADGSSVAFTKVAFTGSYSMDSSSHGTMTLTVTNPPWGASPPANPPPTTMSFVFTLSMDGSFGELVETDGAAGPGYVGSGYYRIQVNSAKFSTQYVSGSYVLGLSGAAGPRASAVQQGLVGRLDLGVSTATTGTIANTSLSDDQTGAPRPTALTGGYVIDDQTNGHGALKITGGANPNVSFYISTPGVLFALRTDNNAAKLSPDAILSGVVRAMAQTSFDNTSLQTALFALQGISAGHASAALGRFASAPKAGSATDGFLQGIVDINDGGVVPANSPLSFAGPAGPNIASFSVAPSGRGTVSLALGAVTYNFVFYMRKNGVAFVLEQPASDGSNRGRMGRFFPQNVMNTAGGTFIGATGVTTAGSENADAVLVVTIASQTGTFVNSPSDTSVLGSAVVSGGISGTLTLTDQADNRGTLAMSSGRMAGSSSAVFYISADTEIIVLGNDPSNPEPQLLVFDE